MYDLLTNWYVTIKQVLPNPEGTLPVLNMSHCYARKGARATV